MTAEARVTIERGGWTDERCYQVTGRSARIRQLTATGESLGISAFTTFDEALQAGVWGQFQDDLSTADMGTLLVWMLQDLADGDEALRQLLFELVDVPGIFSIVANFGVSVHLQWHGAERLESPWRDPVFGSASCVCRCTLSVNGRESLVVDLLAARPEGSLAACGGICGAVLRHPHDAGRWAAVRLLALHEGAATRR